MSDERAGFGDNWRRFRQVLDDAAVRGSGTFNVIYSGDVVPHTEICGAV